MQIKESVLAVAIVAGLSLPALAEGQRYDFEGFSRIQISNGIRAEITEAEDFNVTATARRGDLSRLVIEQNGQTLRVTREARWGLWGRGKRDRFEVEIALPELDTVGASAGSHVTVDADGPDIDAVASSGSHLEIETIDGGDVRLRATSGSTLRASGPCGMLIAEASSGSAIRAGDLVCRAGEVEATSGSSLRAHVTETVEADATSGSSIRLGGGAELVTSHVTSGASLHQD